jgi:lipopolysaccharide/colanic/teichoic acid biosynthesis glycosyltransferase
MHASIREQTVYEALPRRPVPERLNAPWTLSLLAIDVLATMAACYATGIPAKVGPAACVILCAALAGCGVYQRSYAVKPHDDAYHVAAGCLLAAIPFWALLHFAGGIGTGRVLLSLLVALGFMALLHATLNYARNAFEPAPYARAAFITPEAQWRVGRSWYATFKRCADVLLACVALLVLSPLLLLTAVCIAIESGGPIFFRQERVGRAGSTFSIYKFRTMVPDAGSGWAKPSDARITPLGAILRRCSIDELPQLLNVIRGEMSLVGPRPEMVDFAREFRRTIAHYEERHVVSPGITGWAQVQLERNLQPRDMPHVVPYDLFYVEHASPVLDTIILVKTAVEFLFHRAV